MLKEISDNVAIWDGGNNREYVLSCSSRVFNIIQTEIHNTSIISTVFFDNEKYYTSKYIDIYRNIFHIEKDLNLIDGYTVIKKDGEYKDENINR